MTRDRFSERVRRALLFFFSLLTISAVLGGAAQTRAQGTSDMIVNRVQVAVRERIRRERGGRDPEVIFNTDTQHYNVSGNQYGVRGTGTYAPNNRRAGETFSYEGVYNTRTNRVERADYRFTGGGRGDDDDNYGDGRVVPRWLVGTFRGRSPARSRPVTVTIDRSGNVLAVYDDGRRDEGLYADNVIRFGPRLTWDITRAGGGFDARNNRRTERFDRTSDGGVGDDSDRVPRWAVGTFRGTTDRGESELIINRDGTSSIRSLSTNQTFTGDYSNGVLRFEWGSFDVSRDGDGIRTIEVGNRNNQTTYQRVRSN